MIRDEFPNFQKIGIWSIRFIINISKPESFHLVIFCRKSSILKKYKNLIATKIILAVFVRFMKSGVFQKFIKPLFTLKMIIFGQFE